MPIPQAARRAGFVTEEEYQEYLKSRLSQDDSPEDLLDFVPKDHVDDDELEGAEPYPEPDDDTQDPEVTS